jgi:hypothetical protein
LPAAPHPATISLLRETLPASSKAISEAPWAVIVASAGAIAAPEMSVNAASAQSDRFLPARTNSRGRWLGFTFRLVSASELELQSE